jgi:protein-S-isoprenylcysteine O-methyltransferase
MRKSGLITNLLAYALLGIFFASERRLRQGQPAQSLEAGAADRHSTRAIGGALLVSMLSLMLAPSLNRLGRGRMMLRPAVGWAGLAMMASGIALRAWANTVLGASYTRTLRVEADQQLIERGPYHLLRHPGYSGSLLLWLGAGLATTNSAVTGLIAVVTGGAYAYRVRSEEAMLAATFGAAFESYRRRTWKLIPLIY